MSTSEWILLRNSGSVHLFNGKHFDPFQEHAESGSEVDRPSQKEQTAEKRHSVPPGSSAMVKVGVWIVQRHCSMERSAINTGDDMMAVYLNGRDGEHCT